MAKVALITGGMGGIGTSICKALADAGYTVVTTYSKPGKEVEWLASGKEAGYSFHAYQCDVTDFDECVALAGRITADVGPVDVLVNNAGITRDASFKKLDKVNWDAVIKTNLDSVFNVTKQFVDGMTERGWGRVINISSINGQKGQFGQTNYSAAKAGMHGFTMALAQEVARKGVTVNTISPGYIATDMVMAVPEDVRNKIIAGIPVNRLGKPEEIAALVAYMASDLAGFMTGANVAINGGQHTC
ncbi:3-oxoacyl-[acyl-carrier-protein] reductase [Andreprevotia lacus DSM 23236]|jgi:acetoacetyl-CoA reductase|uniref:3-oxoacyl-[acyl-carrier-protein] reductase n=1 Tax=Andreprevotia lacus DSM 23236 TaxID=1121001 RepID=A0A1W1XIJ9_9NEIS|nr:acetoacetyl-CoA reductase [Andreprevotia lacus]SMC23805.1 3-oxoacyl-[acyl-carrier-protein] reductase [Andreprevotia lacus DSM 23236]